ncbi:hypothetical protein NPIL_325641 [Nephila pilipes]|uniref:Uncharacterized protein n=1 Tax=Nephila pilipes TaxID=299642 RepID=A0A8X6MUK7_NEPPI|nr:hypothetical protein NPIL_325641 [Nephila pilipes]
MIIGDVTEEKWQIAVATQNSITVEESIDRATALGAIRSTKQENKLKFNRDLLILVWSSVVNTISQLTTFEILLIGDVDTKVMLHLCAFYRHLNENYL